MTTYWAWMFKCALLLAPMAASAPAAGANEIAVSPQILIYEKAQPSEQRVIVSNQAKGLGYVTIEARQVTAPGETDEQLRPNPDPSALGLAVAPNRLVLEPREQGSLRLLTLAPPGDGDRVWRVKVAPAVGALKPGQSGVSFTVAYDLLVIQRAANARSVVTGQRDDATVRLTNSGNSFAVVSKAQSCPSSGACRDLSMPRLYAGKTVEIPVGDASTQVSLEITQADGTVTRMAY